MKSKYTIEELENDETIDAQLANITEINVGENETQIKAHNAQNYFIFPLQNPDLLSELKKFSVVDVYTRDKKIRERKELVAVYRGGGIIYSMKKN